MLSAHITRPIASVLPAAIVSCRFVVTELALVISHERSAWSMCLQLLFSGSENLNAGHEHWAPSLIVYSLPFDPATLNSRRTPYFMVSFLLWKAHRDLTHDWAGCYALSMVTRILSGACKPSSVL